MNHSTKSLLVGTVGAASLFLAGTASVSANTTHKVVNNDTVWALSQKYGVSVQSIEKLNHISANSHLIYPGQDVQIPSKGAKVAPAKATTPKQTANTSTYSVKAGDSLWSIAQAHKISVDKLLALNNLDSSVTQPGQTLKVVGTVTAARPAKQAPAQPAQQTQAKPAAQAKPEQAQPQQATPQVSANHTTYKVQSGDSLYTVAQKFGVSVDSIRKANALTSPVLTAGQSLTINDPAKDPSAAQAQPQQKQQPQQQAQAQPAQATSQPEAASSQSTNTQSAAQTRTVNSNASQSSNNSTQNNSSNNSWTRSAQPQKPQAQVQQPKAAASSSSYGSVTSYAKTFIGTPYAWGGSNPGTGFDCSGLVQYVYAHFGKQLPRVTSAQEGAGQRISVSQAQPGDLYFWGSQGSSYHVAIALGGGQYIDAPKPGQSVRIQSTSAWAPQFAVRVN